MHPKETIVLSKIKKTGRFRLLPEPRCDFLHEHSKIHGPHPTRPSPIQTSMEIECVTLTDVGSVRANNEDAVFFDAPSRLALLADGMGGYNAGEVASAMAIEHTVDELRARVRSAGDKASLRELKRAMQDAVGRANQAIFEAANTDPEYAGMGTTIVLALLQKNHALIGHVGDSRAYLWRNGQLQRLTRDHSLIQEYIDQGLLSESEAVLTGYRSLLTRALGVEDTLQLEITDLPVQTGDLILLCSDGLTDMLGDSDIATIFQQTPDTLQPKAERLIDEAKANGGQDNVSVALIKIDKLRKKHDSSWWNPLS